MTAAGQAAHGLQAAPRLTVLTTNRGAEPHMGHSHIDILCFAFLAPSKPFHASTMSLYAES